jgi:GNAT superfamily N-acetyltransferase
MDIHQQSRIRPFRRADLDFLQRLIWKTIDGSYAAVYPPRALEFFKEFHAKQKILERSEAGTVLVLEENGDLVATGSLVDGEIFAVFVHPAFQGIGHGKALMRVLEDKARASGVSESLLSVSLPSKRFYEGLGYEIVQECSRDLGAGQRLNFWKAKKRLIAPGN